MSHKRKKQMRRSTRTALITAVTLDLLAIAAPGSAQAQAAAGTTAEEAEDLSEIVVTGFRASLQTALQNKRSAIQPIESIAPEDIGKMPDQNVAESLQRVPGVQINRAGGKGTQVLIHGLSNNLITLNGEVFLTGREFYVSGEASGGGAGGNVQYASLEGIPSEEIGGIGIGRIGVNAVDQDMQLPAAPAARRLDARNDEQTARRTQLDCLGDGALGVVIADGGNAKVMVRQVIDEIGRRPGAVAGIGMEMEIDRVV